MIKFLKIVALFVSLFSAVSAVMPITPENYGVAETQIIFEDYVKKVAKATGTDGVGNFMHMTEPMDVNDRTIVRPNFDTLYSFGVFDLTEPLTLTMPEPDGRYQSAWLITEEHYNPMAFNEAGEHLITQENTGTKYLCIIMRTAANMEDDADMATAIGLMEKIEVTQASVGDYPGPEDYDMDEILAMRKYYQKVNKQKNYPSEDLFGPKGSVPLEAHNVGIAEGWGGLTKEQAMYYLFEFSSATPGTLTLKDVPISKNSFWSVTVYNEDAFATGDPYNINSSFATKNSDGEYVIHFGGDEDAENYLEIFPDWNYTLRIYLPTEKLFDGTWEMPEFVPDEN